MTRERFIDAVLQNPVNAAIVDRAGQLGLPDWWLTGGAVFQTVWNVLDGRAAEAGIVDYDLFYFDDSDLSPDAEEAARARAAVLFADLGADVEVCNEARVHLWYEDYFRTPMAMAPFGNTFDAIHHFVSPVCMYAISRDADGAVQVYAPHGYADLWEQRVRPNPIHAKQDGYAVKTARWVQEWPRLTIA